MKNPSRTKVRIVGFGDSTTAGTPGFRSPVESPPSGEGDERSQYAFWMMKKHPDWEVLNKGVNGERSDQILRRFERDVAMESPKLVVILAGVNDIYQGYPVASTARNLTRAYSLTSEMGALPIGCSVLPYNTMTRSQSAARRELNDWVFSECSRRSIPFCDTARAVCKPDDPDMLASSPDGLHPDAEGYRRMGEAVAKTVEACLAAPEG